MSTSAPFSQRGSLTDGSGLDLIVLVPDADWEQTIKALLAYRAAALGIRRVNFRVIRHPRRDPGVRTASAGLLQPYVGMSDHALVCIDREGSGHHGTAAELAAAIESSIRADWGDRCAAIVADPELEAWVWSPSPHVARALGWNANHELREYLRHRQMLAPGEGKPSRPKEAMLAAMRERRLSRSP